MDQVYPYCIVLFTKESAVEIVPSIWVKGSEPENFQCYWPKFNTRYHVKKKSIPDKEKCEVRIMGKAENYPDACVKLRNAEETSNIENIESDEDSPRKRKTRLPTRYISSESENEGLERRLMIKLDSILENQREQFNFMKQQVYFGASTPACDYGDLLSRSMKTEDEIKMLSEKLENEPEYTKRMVSYLSTVGGRSTSDCVRNILGKIATPQVLMNYSFKGQRGKQSFESLFLCQVITNSCMKGGAYKENDVHLAISDVLRYSKKRNKSRQIDE